MQGGCVSFTALAVRVEDGELETLDTLLLDRPEAADLADQLGTAKELPPNLDFSWTCSFDPFHDVDSPGDLSAAEQEELMAREPGPEHCRNPAAVLASLEWLRKAVADPSGPVADRLDVLERAQGRSKRDELVAALNADLDELVDFCEKAAADGCLIVTGYDLDA
jgi:hypothetical protein